MQKKRGGAEYQGYPMISIIFSLSYEFTMKKVKFYSFYSLNTNCLITILNDHFKLWEYLDNVLPEGIVSQMSNLGPGFIFMALNVNNNENIIFKHFYIT